MLVVSDTSPIRALSGLGLLHVLPEMFHQIVIPPAVLDELEQPLASYPAIPRSALAFATVQSPSTPASAEAFRRLLDAGESEALALALELGADYLLIDERAGRQVAAAQGIAVIGVLGILLKAREQGRVPLIRPLLDRLRKDLHFHISERLYIQICQVAGE